MASDLSYSSAEFLKSAAITLIDNESPTKLLLYYLGHSEMILSDGPFKRSHYEVREIAKALIAKEVVRHPDMSVNISVSCCICYIMGIYDTKLPYNDQQKKEFFELVVMTFEKLSLASGGSFIKMSKVLALFNALRLPVLMLGLHLDELVVRLFKQFLTISDSNLNADVLEMEIIMNMIIVHGKRLRFELAGLIVTSIDTENQIALPVHWKLGKTILKSCATQLKPHLPDMAQSVENGENLVGSRIKVLWNDGDEVYCYKQGVVKSFDGIKKSHEVLYDDGDEELVELEHVQWALLANVSAISDYVNKSSLVCVHGYNVKQSVAHILEAIIKKHGDITSECLFKTASAREYFLDVVCEVVKQIQSNDVIDMQEIESKLLDAEAAKLNVSWIRTHLEAIHKRKESMTNSTLLMEMKVNTVLVKRAAEMDLKERRTKFENAERCAKVLLLVEEKLNNNYLESEAEKDSWDEQSIL